MEGVASTAEGQERRGSQGGQLLHIDRREGLVEDLQTCADGEANAEPTTAVVEPDLAPPGTAIPKSLAVTDPAHGACHQKTPALRAVSVLGSRSSFLPCLHLAPSSRSSSSSAGYREHIPVDRPPFNVNRESQSAPEGSRAYTSRIEDRPLCGITSSEVNGPMRGQAALVQDFHHAAGPDGTLPTSMESGSPAGRTGIPTEYKRDQLSRWNAEYTLHLEKHYLQNGGVGRQLQNAYEREVRTEELPGKSLTHTIGDAGLAGIVETTADETKFTAEIYHSGAGGPDGINPEKEAYQETNVRGINAGMRAVDGTQRATQVHYGHKGRGVPADGTDTTNALTGDASGTQSGGDTRPSSVPLVCTPASNEIGSACGRFPAERNYPYSEIRRFSEEHGEYTQGTAGFNRTGEGVTGADSNGSRADDHEENKRSADSLMKREARCPINPSEAESFATHATNLEGGISVRRRCEGTSSTDEALRTNPGSFGVCHQKRLSIEENGAREPFDIARSAFRLVEDSVEAANRHPRDAHTERENVSIQTPRGVVSSQQLTESDSRLTLSGQEQRRRSQEEFSRSERSTMAGSYCDFSSDTLPSGLSSAGSDTAEGFPAKETYFSGKGAERAVADSSLLLCEADKPSDRTATTQESHSGQSSTSLSDGTRRALQDSREAACIITSDRNETTLHPYHGCAQDFSASSRSPGYSVNTGTERSGGVHPVNGGLHGRELPCASGFRVQQHQHQQQDLQRLRMQQLQRQQAGEQGTLEHHYQLGQEEIGQQHIIEQHQQQQLGGQQQQVEQRKFPRQQKSKQQQQRQQKHQQSQPCLSLKHEEEHQHQQHMKQLQQQQDEIEWRQQCASGIGLWGHSEGSRAVPAAACPSAAQFGVAVENYNVPLPAEPVAVAAKRADKSFLTGETHTNVNADIEEANVRNDSDPSHVGFGVEWERQPRVGKGMGGTNVKPTEYGETIAGVYRRSGADIFSTSAPNCASSAATGSVVEKGEDSDAATTHAGNTKSDSPHEEREVEAHGGRAGIASTYSLMGKTPASSAAAEVADHERRRTNSSFSLRQEKRPQCVLSQSSHIEQYSENLWYHRGTECYIVAAAPTGERKIFLFSARRYGDKLAHGLALACQKNRLTLEQLTLGIPLRVRDCAAAAEVLNSILEEGQYMSLSGKEDSAPSAVADAASVAGGCGVARTAGANTRQASGAEARDSMRTREMQGRAEPDSMLFRYSQQHPYTLQRQAQQDQRQYQECRQHVEIRKQQQQQEVHEPQEVQEQRRQREQQEHDQRHHQQQQEHRQEETRPQHEKQSQKCHEGKQQLEHVMHLRHVLVHQQQSQQEQLEQGQRGEEELHQQVTSEGSVTAQQDQQQAEMLSGEHAILKQEDSTTHLEQLFQQQQHEYLQEQQRQQDYQQMIQQRQQREQMSATQHQCNNWETLCAQKEKKERASTNIVKGAIATDSSPLDRRSPSDERPKYQLIHEQHGHRHQQRGDTFETADSGDSSGCTRCIKSKEMVICNNDSGCAREGCTTTLPGGSRLSRKRTVDRRAAAETERASTAPRKRSRNTSRCVTHMQEDTAGATEAYKGANRTTRYGFETARALAVEARIRSVQALQEQQQQQQQKQMINAQQEQHLHRQQQPQLLQQQQQHYMQHQQSYAQEDIEQSSQDLHAEDQSQQHGRDHEDTMQQDVQRISPSGSMVERMRSSGESKWTSYELGSSGNSSESGGSPAMTEKEEKLLYAGKAAITLVLSDLLEVCLPQLQQEIAVPTQNDLRACIDAALWQVHAAVHPAQLQSFFNLFGSCFLRAKAPSSLPVEFRVHYLEALSGLRLCLYPEEEEEEESTISSVQGPGGGYAVLENTDKFAAAKSQQGGQPLQEMKQE